VSQPADHARLVADSDLPHVDACLEPRSKVFDQLAEVHALLGREVEDHLIAAEEVLDVDGLHVEFVLADQLAKDRHRLSLFGLELVYVCAVLVVDESDHGLEWCGQLAVGHLMRRLDDRA